MLKRYSFLGWITVFFLMISCSQPQASEPNDAVSQLRQASKARAIIVQKVKEAVVHIRVEKEINGPAHPFGSTPFDLFNDEFFERFFPEMQPPRRQQPNKPQRKFKQEGLGTGSIISKDGYILTNHHVVGEADKIIVKMNDGKELEAKLIGTDPESDIAVVRIEGDSLPTLPMGDSDAINVGETVIAVGNPFGLTQTVTMGIISAKGRSNIGITNYEDFIQTDAAINPGNSGGPLINLDGQIIGVNTAIFTRSGGYQGIGFAVPINMARSIMNDLINTGSVSRGWLGVSIQDISPELAAAFKLENTQGSLITGVMEGTPAQKHGIQKGDVIIEFNGKPIKDSNHLRNQVAAADVGSDAKVKLVRKGEVKNITITLDERPNDLAARNAPEQPEADDELGLSVKEVTPELANRLGLEGVTGVIITEVRQDSLAQQEGLRPGWLIQEIDQTPIRNLNDYQTAMKAANLSEGILFLVQSKQGARYIIVKGE